MNLEAETNQQDENLVNAVAQQISQDHESTAPAKYKFGPPGKAFGGWLAVMFWSLIASVLFGILGIFFLFSGPPEFRSEIGIASWVFSSVAFFAMLVFVVLLYKGNKVAYSVFLFFVFLQFIGLVWALFDVPEGIFHAFGRLGIGIAWLMYFYQSERVREHFGTNFPSGWMKDD